MKIRPLLTLSLLLLWSNILCHAQSSKLFTTDKELSSSLINQIYQDKNGFIWIATEDGLNRYDGAKFTIYKHEAGNEHSLSHNFVRCIFEDKEGHLLIGCYNGVQMYDPQKDCFSKLAITEKGSNFSSNINMILQLKNNDILISGNQLSTLKIKKDSLIAVPVSLSIPITTSDYILEDKNENLWVVKDENKIYRFDKRKKATEYLILEKGIIITALSQDTKGNIYVGSIKNGLFKYDKKADRFIPIPNNGKQDLPVKLLYQANRDELYIGTDGEGLKVYNIYTKQITNKLFDNNYFDLTKLKIHSILKDREGNFWLAIYQKGVMMIPAQPNSFKYIGHKYINKNIIGSCCITALLRDHQGTLWIGTDNDGLYGITEQGKQIAHFTSSNSSIPDIIINLFEDSNQNLWLGSFTSGMGYIDKKTGKCTYLNNLTDQSGSEIPRVYSIAEDAQKRLWIATMGGGLYFYDLMTKQCVRPENILHYNKWISSLLYSKEKKLYVGSYAGIYCIDLNNNKFTCQHELSDHIIHSIHESKNGGIWLGTSDGLVYWNSVKNKIVTYTTREGLPSNVIYAIEEDEQNNLWISTDAGISRFSIKNQKVINYFVGDGLQGNEFSKNASFKDANGTIWFGGVNGITYFNPKEIINPAKKWNVRISDFYLHNIPVRMGMKSGGKDIIKQPVFKAKEFHLSHKDNAFTIEFTTKELNCPERIAYTYSMDHGSWIVLRPGINRVSFNNLQPGTHSFKIRAMDYNILSDISEVTILIAPAWYASAWAKLLYFLLFILITFITALQLKHRYRARQRIQKHIHAEEINEAKLQFFINISHEIRTPMSLIISPLQQLINMDNDVVRQRLYHTIHRNAERILSLVNQLMDIRKIDKGQMTLRFQEVNIVIFIHELYSAFEEQAQIKHITLKYIPDVQQLSVWIDPTNFDKIIMNLLSNALKFTPEEGEVHILLHTGDDLEITGPLRHYVEITISDTGIGIDDKEMNRIFERFYQIHNNANSSNPGTGIGLHLTRSLVEMHHGVIHAEQNENGIGSKFIIRLPLGNSHLLPNEIEKEKNYAKNVYHQTPIQQTNIDEPNEMHSKSKTKHRILIVEDDEEIRSYLYEELSSYYHIIESSNGKEAMSLILKKAPSLVISDIMMPEMDGLTLCRKIKQNVNINYIPVILLTAKSDEEDNLEGLDVGADAYLTKPFSIDIVKKTIDNSIKRREMLRNFYTGNQEQEAKKPIFEMQSTDNKLLDRIMNVINRNLSNPELNVEMIASEVGISRVHLHRKLKELTNQSTRDLIRNVRLKQAAKLLANSHYNVTEITDLVGFSSTTLFSRSFKELYGMTPTEYATAHAIKDKPT